MCVCVSVLVDNILYCLSGFNQANLASLLFQLGPECPPSSIPDMETILSPAYMECSQSAKATVIGHEPLSNDELNNLMVHTLHLVLLHSLSLSLSSGRCCPIAPTTVSTVFLSGVQDVGAEDSPGILVPITVHVSATPTQWSHTNTVHAPHTDGRAPELPSE